MLQGIKKDSELEEVKEVFTILNKLVEDPYEAATGAADIYRKLRKQGLTIRKSNDCLIAWYAIRNSLEIVHNDRDFDVIQNNIELLKI